MNDRPDLTNSVIMPREDFIELSTVAFDNHHVPSVSERAGQSTQTFLVFASMAIAAVGGTWGCMKASDWLENRRHERKLKEAQFDVDNGLVVPRVKH